MIESYEILMYHLLNSENIAIVPETATIDRLSDQQLIESGNLDSRECNVCTKCEK
ncbi:hypothetical protein ACFLYQ_00470 [Chloroflexota bacterium]